MATENFAPSLSVRQIVAYDSVAQRAVLDDGSTASTAALGLLKIGDYIASNAGQTIAVTAEQAGVLFQANAIPVASLLGGTGSAFAGVTPGAGLVLSGGTLTAPGGFPVVSSLASGTLLDGTEPTPIYQGGTWAQVPANDLLTRKSVSIGAGIDLTLSAGTTTDSGNFYGGKAVLSGGSGIYGGGAAIVQGGFSNGAYPGAGNVRGADGGTYGGSGIVRGGHASAVGGTAFALGGRGAQGGNANVYGGTGTAGKGGNVVISAGSGTTDGGNLTLSPGGGTAVGHIIISNVGTAAGASGTVYTDSVTHALTVVP